MLHLLATALTGAIFVSPAEASALIEKGAEVLDARGEAAKAPYLPNARPIEWKSTRLGVGAMGRLDDDLKVQELVLQRAGVTGTRPILVYGSMRSGWGEEGRIWWTLRYLGFEDVHILDGGLETWIAEKRATVEQPKPVPTPSPLSFRPQAGLRADWRRVDQLRKSATHQILDVRTAEEFAGATPFGEPKGGHVPGAIHVEWKSFVGADGRVLSKGAVLERMSSLGFVDPQKPIVTYCTGGVRSAFVQAVLLDAGFSEVANYDGSWFDWASRAKLPVARGK